MNRCFSCFKEYDDQYDLCPFCGEVKNNTPVEPIHLYPGTVLGGRYILGRAVGSGGFGIIYKAWDAKLETIVAVKEFFASRLMTRAAGEKNVIINKKTAPEFEYRKTRFLAEARNMAKFGNHRNIPNVFEFFEENGTAYIVMELLDGIPLNEYLRGNGGKLDPGFALYIANEVGNALISLHEKGIIHRDVAPDNVYICSGKDIKIKLLDLGAAKLADSTDDVIDIILKPGYSPVEQYDSTKSIGPWTDIYALGATLYVMLTGVKPEESTNRKIEDTVLPPHEIDDLIPENLSNAVMKAMAVEKHMRFKTVVDFLKAINGEKKILSLAKEKKLRKRKRFTGILAAVIALVSVGTFVFNSYTSKKAEETLKSATLSVWFSVKDNSSEEAAMESVKSDFTKKFPNVKIELKAIPADDYAAEIAAASKENRLPTLFESTDVSDELLKNATDVDNVLKSQPAKGCLFLEQYDNYYSAHKKVPLAFEVPVAFVVTSGAESIDYTSDYFSSVGDFGNTAKIAFDDTYKDFLKKDYPEKDFLPYESFMNNEENTASVMLSSTMSINKVKETLTNYKKKFVYPDNKEIHCKFTYEWSIGNGNKAEIKAAEKLLSWMLGNVYQNTLMITKSSDGQIPLNKTAFEEKTSQSALVPLKKIHDKFVFVRTVKEG